MPISIPTPFAAGIALSILACAFAFGQNAPTYAEKLRPQFHFTSDRDWLNDPNGLVYYDGEYHLFFQRRVGKLHSDGEMTWGHAVSPDLVHWQQLPDAIKPDDAGSIWSGSAVVDWHNTTGFGKDGKPPLVAMYTRAKAPFSQCLAYSNDRGRTWTKYKNNPVIPNVHGLNRDPKVIWHEPTKKWVVAIYLDQRHEFAIYNSPDLKKWTLLQTVTLEGDDECPDFFPLNVDDDDTPLKQWVFTGANGKYVVGTFDGKAFTPQTDVLTNEHNPSFYAAQTYSDIPASDGRRIQIGWLRRDGELPGMPFNQQMSFPATLTLKATPRGPRLFRWPVKEIESLYNGGKDFSDLPLEPNQNPLDGITGELFDIDATIDPGSAREITLNVRGLPITYHREGTGGALVAMDRRVYLSPDDGKLRLRVLVDRTSVEIFADGGSATLSGYHIPNDDNKTLSLTAVGGKGKIVSLTVHELKSAWPQPASAAPATTAP